MLGEHDCLFDHIKWNVRKSSYYEQSFCITKQQNLIWITSIHISYQIINMFPNSKSIGLSGGDTRGSFY